MVLTAPSKVYISCRLVLPANVASYWGGTLIYTQMLDRQSPLCASSLISHQFAAGGSLASISGSTCLVAGNLQSLTLERTDNCAVPLIRISNS